MRVVLHWPSLGPYHLARARGVLAAAPAGTEVVILATAGQVEDRPWSAPELPPGIRLVTAFPERNYPTLSGAEMRPRLRELLGRWRPAVIGISGYGMADSRVVLRWCQSNGVARVLMSESKADDAPRRWYRELAKRYYVRQFGAALCGGTPHRKYLEELGMPPGKIFLKYDVVDNGHFARECAKWRTKGPRNEGTERPGVAVKGDELRVKSNELGDLRPEVGGQGSEVGRIAKTYFLASSRFIERKNLRRLIDAYAGYRRSVQCSVGSIQSEKEERQPWGLVLLGTGPLRGEMMQRVKDEGIGGVHFPGFQQLESLVRHYAGAGAFIHPALQEQWGLVVNEAMACGLPVLVSRTTGAAYDLVQDGINGFRFDPENTAELAGLLGKASAPDFPRERFGRESERIIAEWTPEEFGRNFWKAAQAAGWGGGSSETTVAGKE